MKLSLLGVVGGVFLVALVDCSSDGADFGDAAQTGSTGSLTSVGGASFTTSSAGGTGGAGGSVGSGQCVPVACEQNKVYACANCLDDDNDGKIDAHDDMCLGPCDNNESGFSLDIPGAGNAPCKLDCYFDKDSGNGNDHCSWDSRCDPKAPQAPECPYEDPPPSAAKCPDMQEMSCLDYCLPLVPNGCDCFGCCEIPGESDNFVFLGSTDDNDEPSCTLDAADDPSKCHPCTPVLDCFNDCGKCELCLGKTVLPPECFPGDGGGSPTACAEGVQYCGPPQNTPCPDNYYCITGCCIKAPS